MAQFRDVDVNRPVVFGHRAAPDQVVDPSLLTTCSGWLARDREQVELPDREG